MAEFPAIPLWTDALLADCGHLDDAEFGRYMRILIEMWRAPRQRIPNDDAWLARRFRQPAAPVRALLEEFCQCDGNWWTQKRLAKEWEYVRKMSKQRSAAAKSRWSKAKETCERNAVPHASRNAPTPTPTPTPTPINILASDFDEWWKAYPKKVSKGQARKAYVAAIRKITPRDLLTATTAARFDLTKPEFIPHPSTWLNGERWLDQPAEQSKPNGHSPAAEPWDKRVRDYRADIDAGKPKPFWSGFWGPRPDEPGCDCAAEVLIRYGFGKAAA